MIKKTSVGLLVNSKNLTYSTWNLIERSLKSEHYEIKHIFINGDVKRKISLNKVFFWLITKIERIFLIFQKNLRESLEVKNLDDYKINYTFINPKFKNNYTIYYEDRELDKIKNLKLDVLIRSQGNSILHGKILSLCKYGVLSFHHGDTSHYRGGPRGFWEVFENNEVSSYIIQRLTEKIDNGVILLKGDILTSSTYLVNSCRLLIKANFFMHDLLVKINNSNDSFVSHKNELHYFPIRKVPKFFDTVKYICIIFNRLFQKFTNKFFFKRKWRVALSISENFDNISFNESIEVETSSKNFIADPFLISHNGRKILFVEEFINSQKKGVISAYEVLINNKKIVTKNLGVVIEEGFHLSFPYVFKDQNKIYMVPESENNKDIRLYECIKFPLEWKLKKVLIKNISAGDNVIFKRNNLWWLLTNLDSSMLVDNHSELHIYYSTDLLGNWKPFKNNPIFNTSTCARNAGLLLNDKKIIRLFQKHKINEYGKSVGGAEIQTLNINDYSEKNIISINPDFMRNNKRIHTLSICQNLVAFDFYR